MEAARVSPRLESIQQETPLAPESIVAGMSVLSRGIDVH